MIHAHACPDNLTHHSYPHIIIYYSPELKNTPAPHLIFSVPSMQNMITDSLQVTKLFLKKWENRFPLSLTLLAREHVPQATIMHSSHIMPEKCSKVAFKYDSSGRGAEECVMADVWIENPAVISNAGGKTVTCCFLKARGQMCTFSDPHTTLLKRKKDKKTPPTNCTFMGESRAAFTQLQPALKSKPRESVVIRCFSEFPSSH